MLYIVTCTLQTGSRIEPDKMYFRCNLGAGLSRTIDFAFVINYEQWICPVVLLFEVLVYIDLMNF